MNQLEQGDSLNGSIVTKTTEKSCWLGEKRYSWDIISQMIENNGKRQTKFNLDVSVDWSDKQAVISYYKSFIAWKFYMNIGNCNGKIHLIEVKDNLVFFEGEYYLPAPIGNLNIKTNVTDGWYHVYIEKKYNGNVGDRVKSQSNVFSLINAVNVNPSIEDVKNLKPNCTEIYAYPYGGYFRVEYTHSGRSGLSINDIYMKDFRKFFIENYCSDRWGNKTKFIVVSNKIMNDIMYGEAFGENLEEELNRVLKNSSYDIDDEESWGEYSLRNIKISEKDCAKFFATIHDKLNSL